MRTIVPRFTHRHGRNGGSPLPSSGAVSGMLRERVFLGTVNEYNASLELQKQCTATVILSEAKNLHYPAQRSDSSLRSE
jgi:hypothetical protein